MPGLKDALKRGAMVLLLLLFSIELRAEKAVSGEERSIESLIRLESSEVEGTSGSKHHHQLVVWNLYRFQQMNAARTLSAQERVFVERLGDSDFLIFQEAAWPVESPLRKMMDECLETQAFNFLGFTYPVLSGGVLVPNNAGIGLATLSKELPLEWGGPVSDVPELTGDLFDGEVVSGRRYKNALWTTFVMENHLGEEKTLLIVNMHNLVSRSIDSQQALINASIERIEAHDGPAIFVGDFNTWSFFGPVTGPLMNAVKRVGLQKVPFYSPITYLSGWVAFQMDHIFAKGIHIVPGSVVAFNQIGLSDHPPVLLQFCLEEDREEEGCLRWYPAPEDN